MAAPGIDNNTGTFVVNVSQQTGIDPRVLVSWIQQEGAQAQNGTGGYNYLNLRPAKGDVGVSAVTSGGFDNFQSVDAAVQSTVNRLNNPFARPILAAAKAKATPQQTIAVIASTGWDALNYGGPGGPNLQNTFAQQWGKDSLTKAPFPPGKINVTPNFFGQSLNPATPAPKKDYGDPKNSPLLPPTSIGSFLGMLSSADFWLRVGQVVGGAILLGMGLFLLMKQIGLAAPTTPLGALAAAA